eukprot:SAG11_NODE_470_length_9205_cov_4.727872_4_plen_321_part_00
METLVYCTSGYSEMAGTAYAYHLQRQASGKVVLTAAAEPAPAAGTNIGTMPMWLSADDTGGHAYTVDMGGEGMVHAHSIGADGALTPINVQPSLGAGPCHLTITPKHLLVANYSGGTISVLTIGASGELGEACEFKDHGSAAGSGAAGHCRQDMAHPHQILLDPSGSHCFVPDLGTNKVHSYRWNNDSGALTAPQELMLHPGAGPRHMCFSADGAHAYVLGELDNSVSTCAHQDGTLRVVQTLNALLPGTEHATHGGGAEIIISPDGRHVYATIRGTCAVVEDPYPYNFAFNVIAIFAVQPADGTLKLIANTPSGGNMPW